MTHTETIRSISSWKAWLSLAVFLAIVIGGGSTIGILTAPGGWYAGLDKPPFNPPNWLFAPVWTLLYICIAIAGWRIWRFAPRGRAMQLWYGQLVANWIWSPVFFSLHLPWAALAVCAAMWAFILGFILTARQIDRPASWLMVPYLLWVSFAGVLNASVAWLN
ncbi:MAG: tryptophan-rich sensory protein [Alphaproteobacteria bacterium]|nr:tryptophan-rich sensory protein [Alphaproteobacteria bacterium]